MRPLDARFGEIQRRALPGAFRFRAGVTMNTKPNVLAGVLALLISLSYCATSSAAAVDSQAAAIQVESEVMWYTTMALDDSSVLIQRQPSSRSMTSSI